jgi:hypothetical protein
MASTLANQLLLQLDALSSPPGIIVTLLLVAVVIVVGRFVLALAWRLIWIVIAVVVVLWLLGVVGSGFGIL